ncbi:MAG TPA: hypothetical protein VHQ24_09200, partial [Lachnospiraceae bacterium]|nr:hypothetical protein [Lachnospiraceae bacterium]
MNEKTNFRKYIPAVIIIIMVGLIIHVALNGDSKQTGRKQSTEAVKTPNATDNGVEKNYDKQTLAVVKQMDTEGKTITIFNIEDQKDVTLSYTGGSDIRDKYDKVLSMKQIAIGEMVDAFYMEEDSKLVALHISKEAWEYQGVGNLTIDNINKSMSIADT